MDLFTILTMGIFSVGLTYGDGGAVLAFIDPFTAMLVMGALSAGTGIAAGQSKGQAKKNLRLASIISGVGALGAGGVGAGGLFGAKTAAGAGAGAGAAAATPGWPPWGPITSQTLKSPLPLGPVNPIPTSAAISAQPPGVAPFAPLTASPANTTARAMSLKDKLGMAASAANVAGVGKSFFPGGEPMKGPGPLEPVASGSTDFRPTAMDFAAPIVETTLPYPPGSWPLGPYDPRRRWGGVGGSR